MMHLFPKIWPQAVLTGACESFTFSEIRTPFGRSDHTRSSRSKSSRLTGSNFVIRNSNTMTYASLSLMTNKLRMCMIMGRGLATTRGMKK